nr:hypothetical protein [Tanacetum cinerariifolium]
EEEDPEEDPEEEPIEQLVPEPKYMDGFALYPNPQQEGNINGWLIEDDDEQEEVEEMDDEEMEVDDDDEDATTATARGDDGDDITASRDPQPSEPHGSPSDS